MEKRNIKKYIFLIIFLLFLFLIHPLEVQALTLDQIIGGADNFVAIGADNSPVDQGELREANNLLYNVLLGISMIIAVIIGMILGIKYMLATSEERADIKQTLPAYIVSCIVVFGAFTIWKVIINLIQ